MGLLSVRRLRLRCEAPPLAARPSHDGRRLSCHGCPAQPAQGCVHAVPACAAALHPMDSVTDYPTRQRSCPRALY